MFGIGTPELLVILAVALIVLGPKKLPDLAKSLGRALGEFKRATSDLKQNLEQEAGLNEVRESFKEVKKDILKQTQIDLNRPAAKPVDDKAAARAQENTEMAADKEHTSNAASPPAPDSEVQPADTTQTQNDQEKSTA